MVSNEAQMTTDMKYGPKSSTMMNILMSTMFAITDNMTAAANKVVFLNSKRVAPAT